MTELAKLLAEFGPWGVATIFLLGIRKLYEDNQKLHADHKKEKDENFELILKANDQMGVVLAANTEHTRALGDTLSELKERYLQPQLVETQSRGLLPKRRLRTQDTAQDGDTT